MKQAKVLSGNPQQVDGFTLAALLRLAQPSLEMGTLVRDLLKLLKRRKGPQVHSEAGGKHRKQQLQLPGWATALGKSHSGPKGE